ncbi:hypothetical protein OG887_20460 [Streptomyces sp. NBC_00053]|uniref:hypothetical protein n=1 Tax=unclassified Streptomyces TaxID=2593676 RepID=UPI000F5C07AB|nr:MULTISPECIES: hypothetical protein [unclassified Streptomyces]WSG52033.1 hypothetical protein OHA38_20765 [Streptomyces sp. NBC_01732]WSX02647.1 hypothetical protein OG355_20660 [Streptomyces sp. NBC_00987]MCX5501733.1 hypothetical protein [Streptomyces sp. NBC_00052]MCX5549731.1 hypothetical protein [Streptomyces sp. NBC_00051]RPK68017.1 hypothetical protein EES42_21325 [Streptomyces sp. ADI95-17]
MSSVLVVGYDPQALPGTDAETVRAALDGALKRFAELGVEAAMTLVVFDESAEPALVASLTERPWDVVVVGGGIRKTEQLLPLLEQIVNLIRRHAPQAAIAFNTGAADTVEAAQRRLR